MMSIVIIGDTSSPSSAAAATVVVVNNDTNNGKNINNDNLSTYDNVINVNDDNSSTYDNVNNINYGDFSTYDDDDWNAIFGDDKIEWSPLPKTPSDNLSPNNQSTTLDWIDAKKTDTYKLTIVDDN